MENTELRRRWQERILEYRSSGLTAAAWCEKTGCSISTMKYWITKINNANRHCDDETKWARCEIISGNPPGNAAISIHVGAARIEVNPGFDHSLLSDILRVAVASC